MKIRRGTHDDIPALIPLCREYFEATGFAKASSFSSSGVKALLLSLLSGGGVVAVAEDGGTLHGYVLAAVVPFPFNPKTRVISEIALYSADDRIRKQLDKKVQQVGKQLGATAVCSANLSLRSLM
jgi:hypothetical protein